ncbi:uncharacterized protein LOC141533851 [Cotesia typhae]|uniref:uncharacterized protein LOC141533851 n=1 Tax=Cotesia typhae TaxID=2053667 RepID=UPI003D6956C2
MSVEVVAIKQSLLILVCLSLSSADPPGRTNKTVKTFLSLLRVSESYAPENNSLEAKCDHQIQIFEDSLQNFELWALEMFDASTKIPSGIFQGNIKDLGMYDQCLKVNATVGNETIRGKHCMYTLEGEFNATKLPVNPVLSVCFPATCSPKQVKEKMQGLINMTEPFLGGIKIQVKDATCSEVDDQPWELGAKVTLGVFGSLVTFLLICTFCDLLSRITSINSSLVNTLSKFSLIINGQRILSTEIGKGNLPAIAGIRFYSMCWVILGHTYIHNFFGSVINSADALTWFRSWSAMHILTAPYAVDTFFSMSGFLTSYLFFKEMARGRNFNIFFYYFHRYLRLTPAFMAVLLFTTFLLPKLGSGALWQTLITTESHYCRINWWPMLLYIHNYVYKDGLMCMGHSWYLAVDMQLFWVSPLIIYPLYKKPKLGLIILSAAIAASIITPAVVAAVNKFTVALKPIGDLSNTVDMMLYFYIVAYTRAGPWVLGVLLGYILATGRRLPTPGGRKLGWILAILAFLYSFFTYRIYQQDDYEWNIYWETFQAAFARHFWAFGVCWIIYVSALSHGGILSKFLSLPIYLPFSRLSYSMYLLHYQIQTIKIASSRIPAYFSDVQMVERFINDLVICFFSGFVFSLVFESPFLVLEKLILTGKEKVNQRETVDKNNFEKLSEMSVEVVAIKQSLLILVCLSLSSADPPGRTNKTVKTFLSLLRVSESYAPENNSLEAKCDHQIQIFEDSLQNFELWALEMFDASTKIPSGIFQGNIKDLGMYDQCLKVNATVGNETIRGKHCMYTLEGNFNSTKLPVESLMSVCFPATCSPKQVKEKMQKLLNMAEQYLGNHKIVIKNATCSEIDNQPWELGAKVTLGVFGCLVTFLLICTFCELLSKFTSINSGLINTLGKFSLIVNGQSILSTKVSKDNIPAIAGLKVFSMFWIVFVHAYIYSFSSCIINLGGIEDWYYSWRSTHVFVAIYSLDTFLAITGFLTSYLFLKEMAKRRKFNILLYYLHRYIRLTPAVGALVLFSIYLLPKMSSGALWQTAFYNQSISCKKNWVPILLYGYNFHYAQGMTCLVHTWYLAVDMQLFWVSPLILYPLYKKPKLGLTILWAAIAASVITPATVAAVNKYTTMITKEAYSDITMLVNFYSRPYTRSGPWLLGILTGYLFSSGKKVPSPGVRLIGWILAILAFAYGYFSFRVYQREDYMWNMYWEIFHGGLAKHIWGFGVCWIIYMSALGHGGIVTKFLSHPIYLPLSRVSYSIYLLHVIIQGIRTYSMRTPIYFTELQMIIIIIGDVVTSFLLAIVFNLVFESPFVVLEKLIFSRGKPINQPVEPVQKEITSGSGIINPGFGKQFD